MARCATSRRAARDPGRGAAAGAAGRPVDAARHRHAAGDYALVVRDAAGRELNRIEYSVAGDGNVARRMEPNAELELRLARSDVAPGEELELSIRAPFAGTGLITIERERVHAFKWFRAAGSSSVQRIRVPEGFDGNGYVSVAFVRDPNSAGGVRQPAVLGVVPFSVDLGRRKLDVQLEAPAQLKPGETLEVGYKANRRSRLVVFGVDEGILQVAGWRNPDPLGFFFEKRALEVDTRQILDLLLPEFQALMQAAPGGDAEGGGAKYLNPFKRRRDKPVVFWSGVVDAGPEGGRFRYVVPDTFNGSMRLVAVAVAADGIGVASSQLVARGDFVILLNAPLAVAPGDEFALRVGVTCNVADGPAELEVSTRLEASEHVEVLGAAQVSTPIGVAREAVVQSPAACKAGAGLGSRCDWWPSAAGKRASATRDREPAPGGCVPDTVAVGDLRRRHAARIPRWRASCGRSSDAGGLEPGDLAAGPGARARGLARRVSLRLHRAGLAGAAGDVARGAARAR